MPAGLSLGAEDINPDLARRQLGYGRGRRMAIEHDQVEILSGIRHGETIGSPIAFVIRPAVTLASLRSSAAGGAVRPAP